MTKTDITIGLLSLVLATIITAWVGVREGVGEGDNGRLARQARGFQTRSVESGAQMFDQYCATCHAFNAAGANCPPLNETSGLHGGDLGEGVAWRLEEMHWDRGDVYGYVYATISAGRMESSRPDLYQGTDPKAMAMPAWSQQYGGPLRPDQIKDLATYVVNFRSYLPDAKEEAAYEKGCRQVMATMRSSRPQYVSKCYEKLCQATYEAKGRKAPVMPEPPADKTDPVYVAAMEVYWASFWSGCQSLGGQTPPNLVTATATAAAEVTPGTPAATEAAVGSVQTPAATSPAATGTVKAGGGVSPTATRKP